LLPRWKNKIFDYGDERVDYIINEKILQFLRTGEKILPYFVLFKHFNKNFPENNNIIYHAKKRRFLIRNDNQWKIIPSQLLISKLIRDSTTKLLQFCKENKDYIIDRLKDIELYNKIELEIQNVKHNIVKDYILFIINMYSDGKKIDCIKDANGICRFLPYQDNKIF